MLLCKAKPHRPDRKAWPFVQVFAVGIWHPRNYGFTCLTCIAQTLWRTILTNTIRDERIHRSTENGMIFPHLRSCTLDIKKNPPTPAVTAEWNKNIYELTASRSFDACTWGRNLLSDFFICLMQRVSSKVWKCKLWFLGHWFGGRWGNWGKTNAAYYVSKDILLTSIWRVNYFKDGLKDGLKDFVVLEPCRGFDRKN